MEWRPWLKGIIGAAIGGAANGVTVLIVAPDAFNFGEGLGKLEAVMAAGALVSVSMYLKQSPLPGDEPCLPKS
jgi:hypothetical protein